VHSSLLILLSLFHELAKFVIFWGVGEGGFQSNQTWPTVAGFTVTNFAYQLISCSRAPVSHSINSYLLFNTAVFT